MSDFVNHSLLLATMLHAPQPAAKPPAAALPPGGSSGFAHRLARVAKATDEPAPGLARPAPLTSLDPAHHAQTACQLAVAVTRPGAAAEALAGLLDGHVAWQQRPNAAPDAAPELQAVPLPQVANTVATALYQGATRVHLQVTPPALGTVDVTVHLQAGVMQVVLQTETTETLEALQNDLPALRSTLRGAGLNVGSLRLTLRRKATPSTDDPSDESEGLAHERD